jgi:hypothetical protein
MITTVATVVAQTPGLPTGNYAIAASVVAHFTPSAEVRCWVTPDNSSSKAQADDVYVDSTVAGTTSLSLSDTLTTTVAGDRIDVACVSVPDVDGGAPAVPANNASITATQVTTLSRV